MPLAEFKLISPHYKRTLLRSGSRHEFYKASGIYPSAEDASKIGVPAYRLIEFQLAIPWRVALPHCPPPLCHYSQLGVKVLLPVDAFLSDGKGVLTVCLTRGAGLAAVDRTGLFVSGIEKHHVSVPTLGLAKALQLSFE